MAYITNGSLRIEDKVAITSIKHAQESHIRIQEDLCRQCQDKPCIKACPAHLYSYDPQQDKVIVDHTGCLECGTCMIICPLGAVSWNYPDGGYGVYYRYG
ncbi:MAG TPA: 4Fe-4S dicluster domain-containing protein [Desulfohalobiaceae bacterium]|nr:4Fe-4S dicluster domain-containing protein [Desulfohalobiaceae bacterium]